jgi:hypothetical protein
LGYISVEYKTRNCYKILVEKPVGICPLEKVRRMDMRE